MKPPFWNPSGIVRIWPWYSISLFTNWGNWKKSLPIQPYSDSCVHAFHWRNMAWLKRRQNESIARALGSLKKCSRHLCIQYQPHCLIGSVSRRSENYRISFSCGSVQAFKPSHTAKKINKFVSLHSIHFQIAWQTNWIAAQITEIVGLLMNLRAEENKNKHVCRFSQLFLVVC